MRLSRVKYYRKNKCEKVLRPLLENVPLVAILTCSRVGSSALTDLREKLKHSGLDSRVLSSAYFKQLFKLKIKSNTLPVVVLLRNAQDLKRLATADLGYKRYVKAGEKLDNELVFDKGGLPVRVGSGNLGIFQKHLSVRPSKGFIDVLNPKTISKGTTVDASLAYIVRKLRLKSTFQAEVTSFIGKSSTRYVVLPAFKVHNSDISTITGVRLLNNNVYHLLCVNQESKPSRKY